MTIAYPNFDGLGDWEPAKRIMVNDYDWTDINTNQIDVIFLCNTVFGPQRCDDVVGRKGV
jgi:hypothetical protein